ncbi:glycosyltransferase family 4 protein [Sulfolobus acidocaldarius]|nr:glycosyltransferase [Sulfolobus acidocaldarius]AGE71839.1 hypothetical protein SacN8_09400 [Sulfolobus acidocaldarius N8]AGE74111.1 hypothetical protein SacRon12I_09420 [Sulfolobus acidocaldarius Ron12/I]ALU29972.1 acetyltransferase [Sulfolobus acidocaldarius]WCM35716.1 glycosyltransferase [Sulfolobus acidocaldarius DSM 639]
MEKPIAILTSLRILKNNSFEGGGEKVEYNLVKHLLDKDNVFILPKLNSFLDGNNSYSSLSKISDKIIGFEYLEEDLDPVERLRKFVEKLKGNRTILLDINYGPSYRFYRMFKFSELLMEPSLKYGEVMYISYKADLRSSVLLQGIASHDYFFGVPLNVLRYLKNRLRGFPIDVFINHKNKIVYTLYKGFREKFIVRKLKNSPNVVRIYGMSPGQLNSLGVLNSGKGKVLYPAAAIEGELLSFREKRTDKDDYMVFFARLLPLKGTLELPFILSKVKEIVKEAKLFIVGKFPEDIRGKKNESFQDYFFNLVEEMGLSDHIVYKGYLTGNELYDVVSKAKCVVYPSHEDTFSLSILESITVGTPVVSYDIPGPKSVFNGLPAVKFVREYDIDAMSKEVANLFKAGWEDYRKIVYNDKVESFIRDHTGWRNVSERLYEDLMKV